MSPADLGASPVHLPLREAPHRGYDSAPALFAGVRGNDVVWRDVLTAFRSYDADLWLAPQGLGGHVDHLQVVLAVTALGRPALWWRDAPYALRSPDVDPSPDLPTGLVEVALPEDRGLRGDACACYATQLGFQFGCEAGMRLALRAGRSRCSPTGRPARSCTGRRCRRDDDPRDRDEVQAAGRAETSVPATDVPEPAAPRARHRGSAPRGVSRRRTHRAQTVARRRPVQARFSPDRAIEVGLGAGDHPSTSPAPGHLDILWSST